MAVKYCEEPWLNMKLEAGKNYFLANKKP